MSACSIDDGSGTDARPASSTTTTVTEDEQTATTSTLPASVGIVDVAGARHELTATCFAPGAGEVLAIGIADTDASTRIEVYLQAFLGAPYLGITVIDDVVTTYEAAIDRPLDITYDADILRVDNVGLVTDLDLQTGESTDAGLGTVVIECRSYETELPSGFVDG